MDIWWYLSSLEISCSCRMISSPPIAKDCTHLTAYQESGHHMSQDLIRECYFLKWVTTVRASQIDKGDETVFLNIVQAKDRFAHVESSYPGAHLHLADMLHNHLRNAIITRLFSVCSEHSFGLWCFHTASMLRELNYDARYCVIFDNNSHCFST